LKHNTQQELKPRNNIHINALKYNTQQDLKPSNNIHIDAYNCIYKNLLLFFYLKLIFIFLNFFIC
jgi:hypothetical protein